MEALVCGELVVSPSTWATVCSLLFAKSGAICETDIHTMTDATQTSESDADVCAMWKKGNRGCVQTAVDREIK